MSGCCMAIEHAFGLLSNIFPIVKSKKRISLFCCGHFAHKLFTVAFLLGNCYQSFNNSLSMFDIDAPTIAEYLPLNEEIPGAPIVHDHILGQLYGFGINN